MSNIAGSDVAAWGCGFIGIAITMVLLYRQEEEQPIGGFTPTPKELFDTAEALRLVFPVV